MYMMLLIPQGKVTNCTTLAQHIGCSSPRAVADALQINPFPASIVPCHRVITSNNTLGGYRGKTKIHSLRQKLQLLINEKVQFTDPPQHIKKPASFNSLQNNISSSTSTSVVDVDVEGGTDDEDDQMESYADAQENERERLFNLQLKNPVLYLFQFPERDNTYSLSKQ
ncbi:MAG: hypothetical protein EZS28_023809 [Streblomastix strix]|uniref:Methylated-DNA--protein-cysteine methyltransferase n=1 Tax=Streblomastix strix TaxID=222440 RepID=A0A5J4VDV5_9EUKA|nr:MAG: hypothetical protein EZS28_023809 [Streblomastix strix]